MHSHDHSHRSKNLLGAFVINLIFTIIEFIGGVFTNSIAIMSDAVHDLGDSVALGLAYIFEKIAKKEPDDTYTFGYERFSLLGALISSFILFGGTIYILTQSIPRLLQPETVNPAGMLGFAILGIVFNGLAFFRLHGGHSLNERSVRLHLLEDLFGWVAILIGSIVLLFVDFYILDSILSIGIALYILINVFKNLRDVFRILLQKAPAQCDVKTITSEIELLDGIDQAYHIHVWMQSDDFYMMSIHIKVDSSMTIDEIISLKEQVREITHRHGIEHVTIECEINH